MNKTTLEIEFALNGTINQTIELIPGISKQEFITGLKSGKYLTTLTFSENNQGEIYALEGFKKVGVIIAQEACDDMEFQDFKPTGTLGLNEVKNLYPGDQVYWNDPDDDQTSRYYTIQHIEVLEESESVKITDKDGSELECYIHELS